MPTQQKKPKGAVRWALIILFILYNLFMLRVLLLRGGYFEGVRQLELVPFDTVQLFLKTGVASHLSFINIWGNIGVFMPLGLFLQLLLKRKNIFFSLLLVALYSATAEALQYVLAVGVTDIDDLILNTLGGLLGILVYRVLTLFFKKTKHMDIAGLVTAVAMCCAALFALTL